MAIVIRSGTSIGSADAEDDEEFLYEAFVQLPEFGSLFETTNSKSIVVGRTGTGKTAVIKYIRKNFDHVIYLDPKQIALDHLANSNILTFFEGINVDLHLFYELMWKHVICVTLIKDLYNISDASHELSFWEKFRARIGVDRRKVECLEYLRDWGKSFWLDTDIQIKEIVRKFEEQLKASAQAEIPGFKFTPEYVEKLEASVKQEVVQRAKKVVNEIQIAKLARVIELIHDELSLNRQRKYFVCIDELDERWVDERIQYKLIRSLIEVVRAFRKARQLKIVIPVRSDVLERALTETRNLGFQREKYETYMLHLRWNQNQLQDLIGARINVVYKNKYIKSNVRFLDVFPTTTRRTPTYTYIVERTLSRPRDIIAFVNYCFRSAVGKSQITPKDIQAAEGLYSKSRLDALVEEWQSVHPEIEQLLNFVQKLGMKFTNSTIRDSDSFAEFVTAVVALQPSYESDICNLCKAYFADAKPQIATELSREIMSVAYKIGAAKLKLTAQQPILDSSQDDATLTRQQIAEDAEATIHPMLWRAFGLTPNIG